uniref:Uncharacterized protein n=1 Tax=Anguilla anguilla TaxID=7936 RepID=A0A0E9Y2R5_ANGAN
MPGNDSFCKTDWRIISRIMLIFNQVT